jgi:positive regulator of sigma E activity
VRKKGRVIDVIQGKAVVCFDMAAACAKCEAAQFCQGAKSEHTAVVDNNINAERGDVVYVEQAPGKALLSAFLLFGLPVALAVFGLVLGARWGETWSLGLGISAFVLGLVIAKVVDILVHRRSLLMPRIMEIVKKEEA